jgi:hypothetical protein
MDELMIEPRPRAIDSKSEMRNRRYHCHLPINNNKILQQTAGEGFGWEIACKVSEATENDKNNSFRSVDGK